jgi:hypothetical protein
VSNVDFEFFVAEEVCCVALTKEVSVFPLLPDPPGPDWQDANTCGVGPVVPAPHGAMYRLTVENCGNTALTNVEITDSLLFGDIKTTADLAPGEMRILTGMQISELGFEEDRCLVTESIENLARVDATCADQAGTPVSDEDPACWNCRECSVDIEKLVRESGTMNAFVDADQCGDIDVPIVQVPGGAEYNLVVTNDGASDLINCTINDNDLGIVNVPISDLAIGESRTITSGDIGFENLDQADRCLAAGTRENTAAIMCECADLGGLMVDDSDPACVFCEEEVVASCRVTAGGNKDNPEGANCFDGIDNDLDGWIDLADSDCAFCPLKNNGQPDRRLCNFDNNTDGIEHTWGGQAGAPPVVDGNWTHHCTEDNKNAFIFHSNSLFFIQCCDEGEQCVAADGDPDTRQIEFAGIGQFNNHKGDCADQAIPEAMYAGPKCFEVHLEDIGEPGQGGSTTGGENCEHCPGTTINDGPKDQENDCRDCTDYYEIRIYDSAEVKNDVDGNPFRCAGSVLWTNGFPTPGCDSGSTANPACVFGVDRDDEYTGYFTRAGNVQMHPDKNNGTVIRDEICGNGLDDDRDGDTDCDDKECRRDPFCS